MLRIDRPLGSVPNESLEQGLAKAKLANADNSQKRVGRTFVDEAIVLGMGQSETDVMLAYPELVANLLLLCR